MKKHLALILFIVSLIFAIGTLVNYGGYNPMNYDIPRDQPYATPAPYTFLIWAVIYIWLIIATFQQWQKHKDSIGWNAFRLPLLLSIIVGMFWSSSDNISPWLSFLIIVLMWAGAVIALMRVPKKDPWIGQYPIGVYAGWLTAAIGVSLASILYKQEFVADPVVSIIGILVSFFIALAVISVVPTAISYTIAVVWGLLGIIVHNMTSDDSSTLILGLTAVGALVIAVYGYSQWKKHRPLIEL